MEEIKRDQGKSVFRLAIAIGAIVLLTIPGQSLGKDVSSMYAEEVLRSWKKRYPSNVSWNLENIIKPVLTSQEREALQEVQLDYPLIGQVGDPFEYYVKVGKKRSIVIPIFSVKFLDDLSTATAWLALNGHTIKTLPEYVAMLKYREANKFPTGRYPPPLKALHIPDNALDNPLVDELAQKLLKSTVVYLLCRQLGFIYLAGPSVHMKGLKGSWRERMHLAIESDTFALELTRRMGIPPLGLILYLSAQTYWTPNRSDFSDEEAYLKYRYSAPEYALFPEILYQIADSMDWGKEDYARGQLDKRTGALKIEWGAREIFRLIDILELESIQEKIKRAAQKRKVEDLRPR